MHSHCTILSFSIGSVVYAALVVFKSAFMSFSKPRAKHREVREVFWQSSILPSVMLRDLTRSLDIADSAADKPA